jgi:hypothetical protein
VALGLVVVVVLGTEVMADLHAYLFRHEKVYAQAGLRGGAAGRLFYYDRSWAAFDAALAWLDGQAGPGAILATAAPHWAFLKSGRKAVLMPMERDPDEAQRLLDAVPVTYLIVDEMDSLDVARRYGEPAIHRHAGRWRLVYRAPDSNTRVYQRVP